MKAMSDTLYNVGCKNEGSLDDIALGWRHRNVARYLCPECGRVRDDVYPSPLDVTVDHVQRSAFAGICPSMTAARSDVASLLHDIEPRIILGQVTHKSGKLLGYNTLHFPPDMRVFIRGGKGSINDKLAYRRCTVCGTPKGIIILEPLNIVRCPAVDRAIITNDYHNYILVSREVRDTLQAGRTAQFRFHEVEIVEAPVELVAGVDSSE